MFYSKGLMFTCKQCSYCCRGEEGFVYLSEADLKSLLDWSGIQKDDFITRYCRWVPYYDGNLALCLNESISKVANGSTSYDCIFWDKDIGGCACYEARPVQCRTYPFWDFLLKDRATWDSNMAECPGINTGRLWSAKEIKDRLKLYEDNIPIMKESTPK